jgi:transcriptional regulator with XRE-family HTH domain
MVAMRDWAAVVERMTFAEFLRRLIDERGITPSQVAAYAGVGRSTVNYWLRGVSTPERPSVEKLADGLGLDLDVLRSIVEGRPVDPQAIEVASHTLYVEDPRMLPVLQRIQRRGVAWVERFERAMSEMYNSQVEHFVDALPDEGESRQSKRAGS